MIFQAEEQAGLTARLYLATGIEVTELSPKKDCSTDAVQAAWFPLKQVFDSDPEGSGALVAPFLTALHRWLDRYAYTMLIDAAYGHKSPQCTIPAA